MHASQPEVVGHNVMHNQQTTMRERPLSSRKKGPLFRLCLSPSFANLVLHPSPKVWRIIRSQAFTPNLALSSYPMFHFSITRHIKSLKLRLPYAVFRAAWSSCDQQ